jgi:hypothetical protein
MILTGRTLSMGAATVVATMLLSSTIYSAPGVGVSPISIAAPLPFSNQPVNKVLSFKANVLAANPTKVDFYVNNAIVGTDKTAPFAVNWTPAKVGTYALTAVVTSKSGGKTASAATLINAVKTAAAPSPAPAPKPAPAPTPATAPAPAPSTSTPAPKPSAAAPVGLPLLRQSSMVYVGAFRPPKGTAAGPMAVNTTNGTLFVTNNVTRMVTEISMPVPVNATDVNALPMAELVQGPYDPTDGKRNTTDGDTQNGVNIGGLLAYKNKLYTTVYSYYDALGKQTLSHFTSDLNLALTNDAKGPYRVEAPKAGMVSGYMTPIPTAWQAALGGPVLNGNCCLAIISRSSYGPAAFAIDPALIGGDGAAPSAELLYYPASSPLRVWNSSNGVFNGTTKIVGAAFPDGARSVLFFGSQGYGTYCYGTGAECGDPAVFDKGNHAYPYKYQVWAYDAADLALVREGKIAPWTVTPYEIWNLTPTFALETARVYGATFDQAKGLLYINQAAGKDSSTPIIQVYRIKP